MPDVAAGLAQQTLQFGEHLSYLRHRIGGLAIQTRHEDRLPVVDARDAASAFLNALDRGRHQERYLLGAVNWTFQEFFARLERLTGVSAPMLRVPKKIAVAGANFIDSLYKNFNKQAPFEASEVEMGEYFWYFDSSKAEEELNFTTRDPQETLQDTIKYLRENFLGEGVF